MDIKDYIVKFANTSICMTNDPVKYQNAHITQNMKATNTAYFQFELSAAYDCSENCFGISVAQQGDRLRHYRTQPKGFVPSLFTVMLITKDGKYITGLSDAAFNFCIYSPDIDCVLEPGKYVIIVDAKWDDTALTTTDYRDVVVDVYGPPGLKISALDS
jgi:hypothetical protein